MADAPSKLADRFSPTQIAVVGFGLALVILLSLGTAQYRAIESLSETDAWVTHTEKVLFEIESSSASLEAAKSANSTYLLTGDELARHRYAASAASVGEHLSAVRRLTTDNPRQQRNLDHYEPLVQRKLKYLQDLARIRQERGFQSALAAFQQDTGAGLMTEIHAVVDTMSGEERSLLEVRQAESRERARIAGIAVASGTVFTLLLIIVVTALLIWSGGEHRKAKLALQRQQVKLNELAEQVELAHDAIFNRDMTGHISYWNRGAEEKYGWSKQEALGRVSHDLLKTEFSIPLEEIERQLLAHLCWEGQLIHTTKSGRRLVMEGRWGLVRDDAGRPKGILEINHDVTERRHLEAKFRGLLESAPDAIVVAGLEGRIQMLNAQAERVFGYPREELLNESVEVLVPERLRSDEHRNWANLFCQPKRRFLGASLELYGRRKDGTEFPLEIGLSPLKTELETLVSSGIRDISDRKRVESGIRKLNDDLVRRGAELEATNKELETFAYSVSHDLRAPLRAISGFSQVLEEDYAPQLGEDGRDCLRRVCAATRRMGELIDCLLGLSRLSRQEVLRERVDLSAMAGSIVEILRQGEPGRQVEVVIAPGVTAQADRRLMEVALQNLLANAWKFTGRNSQARIEFGLSGDNGNSVYFVRDNGAGFDMAYANKLFGTFQRLHGQGEFQGHGIGLATVLRVINRHGGRIWAESEVGKGASFSFTL